MFHNYWCLILCFYERNGIQGGLFKWEYLFVGSVKIFFLIIIFLILVIVSYEHDMQGRLYERGKFIYGSMKISFLIIIIIQGALFKREHLNISVTYNYMKKSFQ